MTLDAETVNALADAVRNNEGLRNAIAARGLDVNQTLTYLRANHKETFRMAKAGEIPLQPPQQPTPPAAPMPMTFTVGGTVTPGQNGESEYALVVKNG